jgi:hypothetical protein
VEPGISDTFTITADNGASAASPGFAGFVQGALHSLAVALGIAKPDTIDRQITVTVKGSDQDKAGRYGGDVEKLKLLHRQQNYFNCVLMASAMAAAQVTGQQTQAEDVVVGWAKELDSVVMPGRKMFLSERIEWGAFPKDAVVLLENRFGVTAVNTTYGIYDAAGNRITPATPADGQRALNDMNAALAQGNAITIGINNNSLYSSDPELWSEVKEANADFIEYNHQIQVLKVDLVTATVWVNDSALKVGGKPFTLSAFMKSWQASDYDLTVVSKKAQSQSGTDTIAA